MDKSVKKRRKFSLKKKKRYIFANDDIVFDLKAIIINIMYLISINVPLVFYFLMSNDLAITV
jgi:hypothetical protein